MTTAVSNACLCIANAALAQVASQVQLHKYIPALKRRQTLPNPTYTARRVGNVGDAACVRLQHIACWASEWCGAVAAGANGSACRPQHLQTITPHRATASVLLATALLGMRVPVLLPATVWLLLQLLGMPVHVCLLPVCCLVTAVLSMLIHVSLRLVLLQLLSLPPHVCLLPLLLASNC
jgi:hypothetical protein